jgi:RNA polymerase sigma-70 factor (sigma-E family)
MTSHEHLIRAGSRRTEAGPRAVSGEVDAGADFEAFVQARGVALVRLARGLLRDPDQAEDVVQDVLTKLHQRWWTVRRTGNPDAYVRRMVVNATVSFWRRTARREFAVDHRTMPEVGRVDAGATGSVWAVGHAETADHEFVLAHLRRLPPKQRTVLVLRYYEDLDDVEIAAAMGVSITTVRSNAHRGLARLRAWLSEPEGGTP